MTGSRTETPTCPKCGRSDAVQPIMYGLPSRELMERDDVQFGGCVIGGADPTCRCVRCHVDFDFMRPELLRSEVAERGWLEEGGGRYDSEDTIG